MRISVEQDDELAIRHTIQNFIVGFVGKTIDFLERRLIPINKVGPERDSDGTR